MTDFKDQWDRMTVVERIAHIRADWAKCRETDDPMVLRIASAVAHDVCRQAAEEIERLRKERDEARREAVYQWLRGEAVAESNYGGGKIADALYDRLRSEFPERDAMYAEEPKWEDR